MIDTKTLTNYAQHPELAVENLVELLACVESPEESLQTTATEALENCGPPSSSQVAFLSEQLKLEGTDRLYWCSTLLGRLGKTLEESGHVHSVVDNLVALIEKESIDLSARERAAWALGEIGGLSANMRSQLQPLVTSAPPRLKRLLEVAMTR